MGVMESQLSINFRRFLSHQKIFQISDLSYQLNTRVISQLTVVEILINYRLNPTQNLNERLHMEFALFKSITIIFKRPRKDVKVL